MEENSSVSEYILRMSGYHNHLTQLGIDLLVESVIDRVLQSLLRESWIRGVLGQPDYELMPDCWTMEIQD